MENNPGKYDINELAQKWVQGTISAEERAYFEKWFASFNDEEVRLGNSRHASREQLQKAILDKVYLEIQKKPGRKTKTMAFPWARIAAAAAILLFLGTATTLFFVREPQVQEVVLEHDIPPGGNKAVLTLHDGRKIFLDDASDGKLAEQSGVRISKTAGGQLVYVLSEASPPAADAPPVYNQIETPRGGQYQIHLPDGSKVWLNAASSLRYPARFTGKERVVELTGEGYFEVAKSKEMSFRVKTAGQDVLVLGTHFNINAYEDEAAVKTTLFEGSVKVASRQYAEQEAQLKPGEQSLLQKNALQVQAVDTEEVLAWKNGLFIFNNEPLESIMRKIARWYDVHIVYNSKQAGEEVFWGSVTRFGNVSEVLRMLEETGDVHFRIENKTIFIE